MLWMLFAVVPMMNQGDDKSNKANNGKANKKKFYGVHGFSPSFVSIKPIKANKTVEESPATRISRREKFAPLNMLPKTIPANISFDMSKK